MAWWSKVKGVVQKHEAKMWALSRINMHVGAGEAKAEECALYSRDPVKHPDALNVLPAEIAKIKAKHIARQVRSVARGRK